MANANALRDNIVQRMFISTADENYILARIAFQQGFAFDFLWLSLHALEKYLKAIRLMNDMPRNNSHDIATLYSFWMQKFPGLALSKFGFDKADKEYWRPESVFNFVVRLNEAGAAENRYGTYGYVLFPDELAKVDQIIWSVRRCCHDMKNYAKFIHPDYGEIETIKYLKDSPNIWKISGSLPLEKLTGEKDDNHIRDMFLKGNVPWGAKSWVTDSVRWSSSNSPLSELFHQAKNGTGEPQNEAKTLLSWVKDNIFFDKITQQQIEEAIRN